MKKSEKKSEITEDMSQTSENKVTKIGKLVKKSHKLVKKWQTREKSHKLVKKSDKKWQTSEKKP